MNARERVLAAINHQEPDLSLIHIKMCIRDSIGALRAT